MLPAEDKKARDLIDTKNQADSMVYQTEKQLKEFADKVRRGDQRPCCGTRAAVKTYVAVITRGRCARRPVC